MERALLYLLFLLAAGIITAVFVRAYRPAALVIISIIIYVPSYIIWSALWYLHIVPVDSLLRETFGITLTSSSGHPWGHWSYSVRRRCRRSSCCVGSS